MKTRIHNYPDLLKECQWFLREYLCPPPPPANILNPNKMKGLLVTPKLPMGSGYMLMLDKVDLPLKVHVCSPGVLGDPDLLLNKYVVAVASSAFYPFQLVYQLQIFLENEGLATTNHALDISSFYY